MVSLCTFVLRVAPKNTWSVCFQCSLTEFCRRHYVPEKVTLSIDCEWPWVSSWQKGLLRTASYFRLSCLPDSLLYFILTETAWMSSLEDRMQTDTASPCKIPGGRNWYAVTPNTKHFSVSGLFYQYSHVLYLHYAVTAMGKSFDTHTIFLIKPI